jgi:quinol monooxygenase YgiN
MERIGGWPCLITRLAELEIDPRQLEQYLVLLREEIETSLRLEPGVLMLNAVAIKDAPTQIRLLEVYADQQAYESHIASPHFIKYKTQTAKMVLSLRLIDAEPIALSLRRQVRLDKSLGVAKSNA